MAQNYRVFIAFAVEDAWARDYLVGQARNEKSPFSFTDMSVKEPWDEEWKKKCRSRIKGCDGTIALVSKNSASASGQKWEIDTSLEEGVPVLGIYTSADDRPSSTPAGITTKAWTWDNIAAFLNGL